MKRRKESFMFNIRKKMEELGLREEGVAPQVYWSVVPPWLMAIPEIDLSILNNINDHVDSEYPEMVKQRLENQWGIYLPDIYRWISRSLDLDLCLRGYRCIQQNF